MEEFKLLEMSPWKGYWDLSSSQVQSFIRAGLIDDPFRMGNPSLNRAFLICEINAIQCGSSQDCGESRGTRAVANVTLTLPAGIYNKALTSSLENLGRLTY